MKSLKTTIFALFIMLAIISCGKDDTSSQTSTFSVNPESIGFTRNAGSKSVDVTCKGAWSASVSGSWASVNPSTSSGNGSVSISVTANPDQYKSLLVEREAAWNQHLNNPKFLDLIKK